MATGVAAANRHPIVSSLEADKQEVSHQRRSLLYFFRFGCCTPDSSSSSARSIPRSITWVTDGAYGPSRAIAAFSLANRSAPRRMLYCTFIIS